MSLNLLVGLNQPPPRQPRGKPWLIAVVVFVVIVGGALVGVKAWRYWQRHRVVNVPVETNVAVQNSNTAANVNSVPLNLNVTANTNESGTPLPAEVNLSAPFTSQAPNANWDAVHEEFCEEASVLMAARAIQGRTIKDAADAEAALQSLKQWEMTTFGYFESTTAVEIAQMAHEVYGVQATVVTNPTVDQLKRFLTDGKFVVVPAAGRELHNPNFKQPGPLYHALLLKGYTKHDEFITNDPGTHNGKNYIYKTSVLMNAIHDWNGGDVLNGARSVIVISKAG